MAIPGIATGGGSLDLSSRATSGPAVSGAKNINVPSPPSLPLTSPATWILAGVAVLLAVVLFKRVR